MKARDVLRILGITRRTLTNYVNSGKIKIHKKDNGFYDYNEEDVLRIFDLESDNPTVVCFEKDKKHIYRCDLSTFEKVKRILEKP